MSEEYPVYAKLSPQKLSQPGVDNFDRQDYEPGVTEHYCPCCKDYSVFYDEDEGAWYCDNCDLEDE